MSLVILIRNFNRFFVIYVYRYFQLEVEIMSTIILSCRVNRELQGKS